MLKLVNNTISNHEIDWLRDWLGTYPRLTMGELTKEFEESFSEWLGVKHSLFVNSGSSANMLMLYTMMYKYGIDKIAVPALSWSTDLAPMIQFGIEPVLIDCNLENLSLDLDHLEEELENDDGIGAVLVVHVLGLVPDVLKLQRICEKHDVFLLEDTCEAMGSKRGRIKLGTLGLMSTFSFYFGHHISTVEGGMICTDDSELYDLLLMLRSHGWARDLSDEKKKRFRELWGIDEFNELYTFYVPGFNVRPTEMQAFLGQLQLEKIDDITRKRADNFELYMDLLKDSGLWLPEQAWFDTVSNFAFPVISGDREWKVKRLQDNGVEVRPLIAGSMANQPFYKTEYLSKFLPCASKVDKQGFYVPNHHELTVSDIKTVCRLLTTYGGF